MTTAMEYGGIPFDVPAAKLLLAKIREDEVRVRETLAKWCTDVDYVGPEMPPNWGSWQQLQYFLYTPLGLNLSPSPYWKKGSTGWLEDGTEVEEGEGECKTDDKALEWLGSQHPEHAEGLAAVRELRWVLRAANYVETWLSLALWHTGPQGAWWWLHPSFGLSSDRDERAGAVTGRFAVKLPALQQVPVRGDNYKLRSLFRAPPGYSWVVVDYSQLEVVILAHICSSLGFGDGLRDRCAKGQPDMHSLTAKYVFGNVLGNAELAAADVAIIKKAFAEDRDIVKWVRYGLNYGKKARGFGDTLFFKSGEALGEERAQLVIDALLDFDPEIRKYQDWVREYIYEHQGISSLLGRWCPLPDSRARKLGLRNRAWRRALNYPMQAGGQEVTAAAMVAIHADRVLAEMGFRLCLQVHDEICGLVPTHWAAEAKGRVEEIMMGTMTLQAYLGAHGGTGESWGVAKA